MVSRFLLGHNWILLDIFVYPWVSTVALIDAVAAASSGQHFMSLPYQRISELMCLSWRIVDYENCRHVVRTLGDPSEPGS